MIERWNWGWSGAGAGPSAAPGAGLSRRELLAALATMGAAALAPGALAASAPLGRIIDVHHHMLPASYVARYRKDLVSWKWSPQSSINDMDRNGVRMAIVSAIDPGIWFGDAKQAGELARQYNEYGARMVQDYPGRFGFFATLPLPDTEGSLKEIAYGLDVLKADGIGLFTDYAGHYLGEPQFAPVFDELNRRRAVVYVHPGRPLCCSTLVPQVATAIEEYPFDTTRTITSLLYTGTLTRCTNVRFIFSHGGGTLPFLADRIASEGRNKKLAALLPHGPMHELQRLNFDTASVTNGPAFAALLRFTTSQHVLFGTDFPWGNAHRTLSGLESLSLGPTVIRDIEYRNALNLFPRLRRT